MAAIIPLSGSQKSEDVKRDRGTSVGLYLKQQQAWHAFINMMGEQLSMNIIYFRNIMDVRFNLFNVNTFVKGTIPLLDVSQPLLLSLSKMAYNEACINDQDSALTHAMTACVKARYSIFQK